MALKKEKSSARNGSDYYYDITWNTYGYSRANSNLLFYTSKSKRTVQAIIASSLHIFSVSSVISQCRNASRRGSQFPKSAVTEYLPVDRQVLQRVFD
jgi:hypothetical protein